MSSCFYTRLRPGKENRNLPLSFYLVVILAGCGDGGRVEQSDYVRVVNVQVTEIAPVSFTSVIRVTGSVEAMYDVMIVVEEGGIVEEILVPRGARIRKEQAVARIDSEMLEAQLEEGRAAAELAREQWERQRHLWEEQQIGTELAYIQARETARMRAATVRTLETRLRKKTIRSPVDGSFEDYYFEEGEYALPAVPFVRIVSLDQVKINGGVPERFTQEVRIGSIVDISIENCPWADCTEEISFVGDTVDPDSRTFTIEVLLPNPDRKMKPGMIANINVRLSEIPDALVVPQEAVLRNEDGYQVFVVESESDRDVARARNVTLGPNRDDRVVILEGLEEGDRVITVGQLKLGTGDLVKVVGNYGSGGIGGGGTR